MLSDLESGRSTVNVKAAHIVRDEGLQLTLFSYHIDVTAFWSARQLRSGGSAWDWAPVNEREAPKVTANSWRQASPSSAGGEGDFRFDQRIWSSTKDGKYAEVISAVEYTANMNQRPESLQPP